MSHLCIVLAWRNVAWIPFSRGSARSNTDQGQPVIPAAEYALGPPGDSLVRRTHLSKEAGQTGIAGRLSVEGVPCASLGLPQSVVEYPLETVTFVLDPRCPRRGGEIASSPGAGKEDRATILPQG